MVFQALRWHTFVTYQRKRMKALILLAAISANAAAQTINPEDIQIGSSAELWFQRSKQDKEGFLDGFCEGLLATPIKLGMMYCAPGLPSGLKNATVSVLRFCGMKGVDTPKAIAYFDNFYKQRKYSDIATWAVVASYNDKACGENEATASLARMQKKNECNRVLANVTLKLSKEARQKQQEYCDGLPTR